MPSHVGIPGNEEVDKFAREALRFANIDIEIGRESADIQLDIKQYILNKWQSQYNDSETCLKYRSLVPEVSLYNKYKHNSSRRHEIAISRLRLGKCGLNWYLFRQASHENGLCGTCQVPETIEHYLLTCTEDNIKDILKVECEKLGVKLDEKEILNNKFLTSLICKNLKRKL